MNQEFNDNDCIKNRDSRKSGSWPSLVDVEAISEKKIPELAAGSANDSPTSLLPLTQNALLATTGHVPRDDSDTFSDKVSNFGIGENTVKQGVRATWGEEPTELLDWDGKWAPAPVDWETARPGCDVGYISTYIREWQTTIPYGPSVTLDINNEGFTPGKCPVDNDIMAAEFDHVFNTIPGPYLVDAPKILSGMS